MTRYRCIGGHLYNRWSGMPYPALSKYLSDPNFFSGLVCVTINVFRRDI
ncbi:MAG: hypothetical protein M0Q91_14140 [Methanoregula sp.]|nr:hypothetical protein [Methanoregula sp.]